MMWHADSLGGGVSGVGTLCPCTTRVKLLSFKTYIITELRPTRPLNSTAFCPVFILE